MFVWDLWLSGLYTGIPVIDPGFNPGRKSVSILFGLCFMNILLSILRVLMYVIYLSNPTVSAHTEEESMWTQQMSEYGRFIETYKHYSYSICRFTLLHYVRIATQYSYIIQMNETGNVQHSNNHQHSVMR